MILQYWIAWLALAMTKLGDAVTTLTTQKGRLRRPFFLRLFELDEGLVDPSPAVVSPPHTAPDYRAIDRTPRNDQGPNVPEPRPGGTEADIKLIVKIVQHEATQRLDEARPPHLATASHRVSELSAWGTRLN
jgi:hypothetical protein